MGVAENFQAFRDNYLIDKPLISSISARYRRITRQLNSDFWNTVSETAHSLYIGSYGRDTAAKGVSDIDILFELPYGTWQQFTGYAGNGQSGLLQAVRSSMQRTYPTTSLKGDGQVVVVRFTDGITFEVLPAFLSNDGGVIFPDSNRGGTWKTCNPRAEMNAFAIRNVATNHNLKALARMMRIWRDENSVPISGMLVDTLAYNFIEGWTHKDKSFLYHDYLVRDFLAFMAQQNRDQVWWRAPGSGSWVRRNGVFEPKAESSYRLALRAIQYDSQKQAWSAHQVWRQIFGSTYPNA